MPTLDGGDDPIWIGGPDEGLGLAFCSATKRLMAACRSTSEWNVPRLRPHFESLAKKPSTALSHEHEVGVKWKVKWVCRSSLERLRDFETKWGARYPAIGGTWRRAWDHVVPLCAFPPAIRKMVYTNAVESLHRSLRKIIKTRGSFPNDDAAMKLLYLALQNAGVHWSRQVEWTAAMSQFAILFGDRFAVSAS